MLAHICNPSAQEVERWVPGAYRPALLDKQQATIRKISMMHKEWYWKLLSNLHMFTPMHMCICTYVYTTYRWIQIHTHTSKCIPMHRGSYFVEKKQGNPICHGIWTLDQVQMNNDYTWDHGNWRQSSRDIKPASGPSVDYSNSCLQVNYRRPFLPLVLTVKRLLIKDKQLSYCESYVILLSY